MSDHTSISSAHATSRQLSTCSMGHSDISVTMNTYTHLGLDDACEELHRMGEIERARAEQERMDGEDNGEAGMMAI